MSETHSSKIYMIGGPNGAGKTTSAMTLLPDKLACVEFVNADIIAAGLSPFSPNDNAMLAGRLMLTRMHQLAETGADFAFETTMASKTFAKFLKHCKQLGYEVNMLYLWLNDVKTAITRVADRVKKGGHHIPEDVVRRRYQRGLENFMHVYRGLADSWLLCDNSNGGPNLIADEGDIYDPACWYHIVKETHRD